MKLQRICCVFIFLWIFALLLTGCERNIEKISEMQISVESVEESSEEFTEGQSEITTEFYMEETENETVTYMEQDIGEGVPFVFCIEEADKRQGELFSIITYKIDISRKGEEPFQTLSVESTQDDFIHFEDFNADGYMDMECVWYYGANGGSSNNFIWSKSQNKFVEGPEELEAFSYYSINDENRTLSLHLHGSAISGTEKMYQWHNEMDLELIKLFDHDDCGDKISVIIKNFDKGSETILSDYMYSIKEYEERINEIWGVYWLDFVWQKEVKGENDNKYVIRYAQDIDSENKIYNDYLYVFDEETYIVKRFDKKDTTLYDSVQWKDGKVVVSYKNGTENEFDVLGII